MRLTLLIPLLVLLAASLMWLSSNVERGATHVASQQSPSRQPRYTLSGVDWLRTDQTGKVQLHATADTVEYYDDQSAQLARISIDQLGGPQGIWRLSAPAGEVPAGEQRILLGEPVTLTGHLANGRPMELTTNHLWVDNTQETIHTGDPVEMQSGPQRVHATGFAASWTSDKVQLLNDVKVDYAQPG
ncbi:MAG: LPS export ABC transporter periplasmic protein LptC [Stenotrophobium sp.]